MKDPKAKNQSVLFRAFLAQMVFISVDQRQEVLGTAHNDYYVLRGKFKRISQPHYRTNGISIKLALSGA